MAVLTVEQLKARFETGDYPRESDYVSLIDTLLELAGGSASITASDTAPVNPDPSALWYNTTEARPYVFYDNFWVELVPTVQGPPGPIGATGVVAATSPLAYDTNSKTVSISTQSLFSSPSLTGTPTAPTASSGTNTTQLATTEFVRSEIAAIVDSAPSTLDTLNELAAALGDDASFAATITASIGDINTSLTNKQNVVANISSTEIGYLDGVTSLIQTQLDAKSPLTQPVVGVSSNYTFTNSDNGKFFYVGGTITLTIPGNVFSAGDQIDIVNDAAGVITFVGSGLTISSKASKVTVNTQYAGASIKFLSPTVAYLIGDLA
jgi:hypothetical protein